MSLRKSAMTALCAAVIIPAALSAQNTQTQAQRDSARVRDSLRVNTRTRLMTPAPTAYSQQRVRVQKDYRDPAQDRADSIANAERMRNEALERARQDSINMAAQRERDAAAALERARADSIARIERMRQDSINAADAARRDSIARANAVVTPPVDDGPRGFVGSAWHIGVSAGGTVPMQDFKSLGYNHGFEIAVPIEFHPARSFLGVRADLGYSQFDAKTFNSLATDGTPITFEAASPKVLSATLNLTGHIPLTSSRKVNLYALGGAGVYHFRGVGTSALGGFLGNDVFDGVDESTEKNKTKMGYQAGGGIDFGFGRTSLFLESRWVNVVADRDENVQFNDVFGANRSQNVRWVPIVLGIKIR